MRRGHLEAADGDVHLTAPLIRTVEHLQHAVGLHNWAAAASFGPATEEEDGLKSQPHVDLKWDDVGPQTCSCTSADLYPDSALKGSQPEAAAVRL